MTAAVVFDIGETLIWYGNPLSWRTLYRPALERVSRVCGLALTDRDYASAAAVLERYNTRLYPRSREVSADEIFREILEGWGRAEGPLGDVKREFFAFFKQNQPHPFPDVPGTLAWLKRAGVRTATLSDVAYGEDNETALADLGEIADDIDLPLTSRDVGWRKPDSRGLLYIAERFQADVRDMIFVGDEEKDVVCANGAGAVSVLIDRQGRGADYGQRYTISSMDELQKIIQERG